MSARVRKLKSAGKLEAWLRLVEEAAEQIAAAERLLGRQLTISEMRLYMVERPKGQPKGTSDMDPDLVAALAPLSYR